MNFSKLLTTTLLATTLATAVVPKKSHAGLFILVAAGSVALYESVGGNDPSEVPGYIAIAGATVGALGGLAGQIISVANIMPGEGVWGSRGDDVSYLFLTLDAEYPTTDTLAAKFQSHYPFIDDESALRDLSQAVSDKFYAEDKGEGVMVRMSKAELSPILNRMNLSKKEKELIINDLK